MSPLYFNHEMALAMAGVRPVVVPTDAGYGLRLDALEAALTDRTRMVVTISPNDPAGVVYPPADLRAVNCPPVVSQGAALGALRAGPEYFRPFGRDLGAVRTMCLQRLAQLGPGGAAEGTFYLLVRLDSPRPPMTVVERLVREHGVAAIPGDAFGLADGCTLRIAYGSLDADTVAAGMDRLTGGLRAVLGRG